MGQVVAGDHIVSTKDNMLGLDGNKDILVIQDAFSGFQSAYPMPDKTVDSTMDAINHVKGERNIERFYSDRFGDIDRAVRDLLIVSGQQSAWRPAEQCCG